MYSEYSHSNPLPVDTRSTSNTITVHDLPYELLTQIFLLNWVHRTPGEYSIRGLTLSSVCSRWRAVALSLPRLWSTIHILSHENPDSPKAISFVRLHLDRSRDELLEVFIGAPSIRLLEIMLTHSKRWRRAYLVLDSESVRRLGFENDYRGGFPVLEDLHLSSSGFNLPNRLRGHGHGLFPANTYIRLFTHSPSLRNLHINIPSLRLDQLDLPWSQIHTLSMSGANMDEVYAVLRLCSQSIVSASFDKCSEDLSYSDRAVECVCPRLEDLTIKIDRRCTTLGNGFVGCVVPRLRRVEISSEIVFTSREREREIPHNESVIQELTTLLVGSPCSYSSSGTMITSLTFSGINYTPHQLLGLLRTTPNLVKLDLCDVGYRSRNFQQLSPDIFVMMMAEAEDSTSVKALTGSGDERLGIQSLSCLDGQLEPASLVLNSRTTRLLPRLREFGIDVPARISEERSGLGYMNLQCLCSMIESRRLGCGAQRIRSCHPGSTHTDDPYEDDEGDDGIPSPVTNHGTTDAVGSSSTPRNYPGGFMPSSRFRCVALRKVNLGPFWRLRLPGEIRERVRVLEEGGLVVCGSVVRGGF